MTEWQAPPGEEPEKGLRFGQIWGGLVIFGIIDFIAFFALLERPMGGLILGAITALIAGLLFIKARSVALGVVAGYVLMSVCSGGQCTFILRDPMATGGPIAGLFLYPLALVLSGVVGLIVYFVRRARQD